MTQRYGEGDLVRYVGEPDDELAYGTVGRVVTHTEWDVIVEWPANIGHWHMDAPDVEPLRTGDPPPAG
jgi:hypothetical protein